MDTIKSISLVTLSILAGATNAQAGKPAQKNVLLITLDDMRPDLHCYGEEYMHTPTLDALAADGVLFSRAYTNIAVSGASRACIMTGTRPTRNTFDSAHIFISKQKPDKLTMNEWFQSHGYLTICGNGKVIHQVKDHAEGWDIYRDRMNAMNDYHGSREGIEEGKRGLPYECMDLPDSLYVDAQMADNAVKDLQMLAKQGKPFFYGLGFYKPHLPFNVPKRYWDLYDRNLFQLPDNYELKEGHDIPDCALPLWGELRNNYSGMPSKREPLPEDTARTLIHGYHAAVSYTDAQLGKVISELKRQGLYENTVIVVLGDHGWNLGEHGVWCKHSILETSLHAPLIIIDPSAKLKGHVCNEVVEFVQLFPTICDMVGMEKPEQLEAESIKPLLNSKRARSKGWALCRWAQGYTLVTDDNYFYTEWWDAKDRIKERLLFDHNTDPDENYNVARRPEYKAVVEKLSPLLMERRGAEFDKYPKVKD